MYVIGNIIRIAQIKHYRYFKNNFNFFFNLHLSSVHRIFGHRPNKLVTLRYSSRICTYNYVLFSKSRLCLYPLKWLNFLTFLLSFFTLRKFNFYSILWNCSAWSGKIRLYFRTNVEIYSAVNWYQEGNYLLNMLF